MPRTPFFGPTYQSRSTNAADSLCINLYPSLIESRQGKEVGSFYTTPAHKYLTTVGPGPIRALYSTTANQTFGLTGTGDVVWGVSGNTFFYLDTSGTPTVVGNISPFPSAYCYNIATRTFTRITLPFTPSPTGTDMVSIVSNGPQIGVFVGMSADQQDGFVLVNQPLTYVIWQSNQLDLTTWNGLNFASASGNPDAVTSLSQIHREFFVHKAYHTEVWVNAGAAGFAFQRLDGVYIEAGCNAPQTVQTVGESLMWLAKNTQGEHVVVQCTGYNPIRVSTHYIERQIGEIMRLGGHETATAYAYQQDGHIFYVLNVGDQTFVYDVGTSASAQMPMWHQRDTIDNDGVSHRQWGDCAALLNDRIVVGDYRNANIYTLEQSEGYDSDASRSYPRRWLRSWRALPKPTDEPTRFSSLRLDMETGLNVPQGVTGRNAADQPAPYCTLQWSDDGGHQWSNGVTASAGALGETAKRVMFRRLGATRRHKGLDRLFQVSSGDCFPAALIGAELQ